MLIAAHHPEFFPSLGFFEKMRRADLFVLLDGVSFDRTSLQHRAVLVAQDRPRCLSVPLLGRSCSGALSAVRLGEGSARDFRWGSGAIAMLETLYSTAPYYYLYAGPLAKILKRRWERLLKLDEASIDFCREALDLRTPIVKDSELRYQPREPDFMVSLCRAVGADSIVCESASPSRVEALERAGISVICQSLENPRRLARPWRIHEIGKISILDVLFHIGPQAGLVLEGRRRTPAATL